MGNRFRPAHAGLTILGLAALALASGAGCAALAVPTVGALAQSTATSAATKTALDEGFLESRGPTVAGKGRYFDFRDVLIPAGLSLNLEKSVVFSADGQSLGLLAFEGRLQADSLVDFFKSAMGSHGWENIGHLNHPEAMLFYSRPGRACAIRIYETYYYSHVHVWVLPVKK